MGNFDPGRHKEQGGNFLDKAGVYILAFTAFTGRDETKKGTPYIQFTVTVIAGTPSGQKGKTFRERVFLTEAAEPRLASLCRSMGWEKPFDTENDDHIRHVLLNRPFKAGVSTEVRDGKTYAKLGFSKPRREIDGDEQNKIDAWVNERINAGKMQWDDSDELPEGSSASGDYDDAPPHNDDDEPPAANLEGDDIPF